MGKHGKRPQGSADRQAPALKANRGEAPARQAAPDAKISKKPAAKAALPPLFKDDAPSSSDMDDEEEEEDSFDFDSLTPAEQAALIAELELEEEDEEDLEEGDFDSDDEEGEEEEGGASENDFDGMGIGEAADDSDMEDDDEEKTELDVNWDAREMFTRHVDAISSNIDSAIPDGENLVDRHDFGLCLRRSIAATLITVTEMEEDDASDVSVDTSKVIEDENTYGVCAFVPVSAFAKRFESCAGLLKVLGRAPEHTIEAGTPALRLLKSNSDAVPARALLFVNDHLNVVPPNVIASVHAGVVGELDEALAAKKHEGFPIAPVSHIVMLARVQRTKGVHAATPNNDFDLGAHDFCRWEDETYYRKRDKRIATVVHKFPRYVENQEDPDIPRCVVFALELAAFRTTALKLADLAAVVMSRH